MSDKKKALEILEGINRIRREVDDQPLPRPTDETVKKLLKADPKEPLDIDQFLKDASVTSALTGLDYIPEENIKDFDPNDLYQKAKGLKERMEVIDGELQSLAGILDKKVKEKGLTVKVNTRKDLALRAAIKRVFGEVTNKITWPMYQQALELRNQFNKEELDSVFSEEED